MSLQNQLFYMPDKLWKLYNKDLASRKAIDLLLHEVSLTPLFGTNLQDAKPETDTTKSDTTLQGTDITVSSNFLSGLGDLLEELDIPINILTRRREHLRSLLKIAMAGTPGQHAQGNLDSSSIKDNGPRCKSTNAGGRQCIALGSLPHQYHLTTDGATWKWDGH